MRVVFATQNPGKAEEARAILAGSSIDLVTYPLFLGDIEVGQTYLDNARIKATNVSRLTREAVLAEDAGLEVDALDGAPGVHTARFAGPTATASENNAKLLELLKGIPAEERTARYRAVAVLLLPDGTEHAAEGTVEGRIGTNPRGEGGFGYDPVFIAEGYDVTAAELDAATKNEISHRGRALRALLESLPTQT